MVDNDDKLLQIDRIRHFDGNEEYMMERENRDLGARFIEYLRSQDTPVVVELEVDVFPDTELGGYSRILGYTHNSTPPQKGVYNLWRAV